MSATCNILNLPSGLRIALRSPIMNIYMLLNCLTLTHKIHENKEVQKTQETCRNGNSECCTIPKVSLQGSMRNQQLLLKKPPLSSFLHIHHVTPGMWLS